MREFKDYSDSPEASNYYVLLEKDNRHPDILAESNFDVALRLLGGDNKEAGVFVFTSRKDVPVNPRSRKTKLVIRSFILINKSAKDKLEIAKKIENELELHAELDPDDYEKKESDYLYTAYVAIEEMIWRDLNKKYELHEDDVDKSKKRELNDFIYDHIKDTNGKYDYDTIIEKAVEIFGEEFLERGIGSLVEEKTGSIKTSASKYDLYLDTPEEIKEELDSMCEGLINFIDRQYSGQLLPPKGGSLNGDIQRKS